jgi:hypothetical protein
MKRTLTLFALAAGLLLLVPGCALFDRPGIVYAQFHAPVQLMHNGNYEIGALVNFQADKVDGGRYPVAHTQMTGSVFTDMLGVATCNFNYNLATTMSAPDQPEHFEQGARVIAWIQHDSVTYADTAFGMPIVVNSDTMDFMLSDTMRINLP